MKQKIFLSRIILFVLLAFQITLKAQSSEIGFQDKGLFGIKNGDEILVPAIYESIRFYGNANGPNTLENRRWLVKSNNLQGIINSLGDTIVSILYEKIGNYALSVMGQQLFTVQKNGLNGVVNSENRVIVPIKYYSVSSKPNYFQARDSLSFDFYNEKGDLLFTTLKEYPHLTLHAFNVFKSNNYFQFIKYRDGDALFFKDVVQYKAINWLDQEDYVTFPSLFELTFENGNRVLLNTQNGKFLSLDKSMKITANHFANEAFIFIAEKEGKFGLINFQGETLLEFAYSDLRFDYQAKIKNDDEKYVYNELKDIKMIASKENKYALIFADGKPATEFLYDNIENINYHNDSNNPIYKVINNGLYTLMSKTGQPLISEEFDYISSFGEEYALAFKGSKVYLFDKYLEKQELNMDLQPTDGFKSIDDLKASLQELLLSQNENSLESFIRKITPSNYTMSFMALTKLRALSYFRPKNEEIDNEVYDVDDAVKQNIEAFKNWLTRNEGKELAFFNDYMCTQSDIRLLCQCRNMKNETSSSDLFNYLFKIDGNWFIFNPNQFHFTYNYNSFYK